MTGRRFPLLVAAAALFGVGAALAQTNPAMARRAFIRTWTSRFRACHNLSDVRRLPDADFLCIRTFPTGEWVAVSSEHSCCSGAGFDATIFYDSRSQLQVDTTYSFCGYEGLVGALPGNDVGSLARFYDNLRSFNLRLVRQ